MGAAGTLVRRACLDIALANPKGDGVHVYFGAKYAYNWIVTDPPPLIFAASISLQAGPKLLQG